MTKIRDAFKDGKAFIPFLTCGDPDLETTEKLVCCYGRGRCRPDLNWGSRFLIRQQKDL